jgi:hypothetical protein
MLAHQVPFVEIPLNYRARVGESSVTGSLWKAWKLGWRMIFLVWQYRLGLVVRERTLWPDYLASLPAKETVRDGAGVYALARAVKEQQAPAPKVPTPQ